MSNNNWIPEIMYEESYNKVRNCLGLEPLRLAAEKGLKITESVRNNLDNS